MWLNAFSYLELGERQIFFDRTRRLNQENSNWKFEVLYDAYVTPQLYGCVYNDQCKFLKTVLKTHFFRIVSQLEIYSYSL